MRDGAAVTGNNKQSAQQPSGAPSRQLSRVPSSTARAASSRTEDGAKEAPSGGKDNASMLERRLRGARERVERIRTEASHHHQPQLPPEGSLDSPEAPPPQDGASEGRDFAFGTGDFGEVLLLPGMARWLFSRSCVHNQTHYIPRQYIVISWWWHSPNTFASRLPAVLPLKKSRLQPARSAACAQAHPGLHKRWWMFLSSCRSPTRMHHCCSATHVSQTHKLQLLLWGGSRPDSSGLSPACC